MDCEKGFTNPGKICKAQRKNQYLPPQLSRYGTIAILTTSGSGVMTEATLPPQAPMVCDGEVLKMSCV